MPGGLSVIFTPKYTSICIVPRELCNIWTLRFKYFSRYLEESELTSHIVLISDVPTVSEELLKLVHSEEYINTIRELSCSGVEGFLDLGDTRYYPNVYNDLLVLVGGSIKAADMVAQGLTLHSYNPYGGLHHARRARAAGFCIFNDVAIVARYLQRHYGFEKIAIVDIDVHHADGTQELFYNDPTVLVVSVHAYGDFFYPGTGLTSEIGEGRGEGYTINIPLPLGSGDDVFKTAIDILPYIIESYSPDIILVQAGVDGLKEDTLGKLNLTVNSYMYAAKVIHEISHNVCNGLIVSFGGGGYSGVNSAKAMIAFIYELSKPLKKQIEMNVLKIIGRVEETKSNINHIRRVENVIRELKERIKWVKWG